MRLVLSLFLLTLPIVANAQVEMTTGNRSLGPGTYDESLAQIKGATPPSDGYKNGWQSSKPGNGGAGTVPLPNNVAELPEE